jgi:serine/threonine-protein kinase
MMAAGKTPDHLKFNPGNEIAGQYRVTRFLGDGATAIVYLAVDTFTNETRALKFPLYQRRQDLDAISREMAIGNLVRHPSICKTFTTNKTQQGITFGVMEHIDGEDLLKIILRNGRCDNLEAIRWAIELCAGMKHFHDRQIVHRDLKPANLMIDGSGHLKIMDLGLAAFTGAIEVVGTLNYMPPERLSGQPARPSSDMYAIGAILYEMFTGLQCLPGDTVGQVRNSQKSLPTRRPSVVAGVDASVDHTIMKCLQENPDLRPDAESLRRELELLAQLFKP